MMVMIFVHRCVGVVVVSVVSPMMVSMMLVIFFVQRMSMLNLEDTAVTETVETMMAVCIEGIVVFIKT